MSRGLEATTLATAVGCGLVGGVFFAFSTFVMRGLDRLPPAQGIAAMQSINRTAVSPLFMAALFGTGAACVGLMVWVVRAPGDQPVAWVLAGGALYIVGALGVTVARNVPLNDTLAALDPHGAGAPAVWSCYLRDWTGWNHVRTIASLGSAALLLVAQARGR